MLSHVVCPHFDSIVMVVNHNGKIRRRHQNNATASWLQVDSLSVQLTTMVAAAEIAIVSFDKFINGDYAEKRTVAKQLYNAFSSIGWVYLSDFGIPQERVDQIFELVR